MSISALASFGEGVIPSETIPRYIYKKLNNCDALSMGHGANASKTDNSFINFRAGRQDNVMFGPL